MLTDRIKDKTALPLFSFTLFLSAACMFALQPMVGKMLLPLVGGTPAGWVVAMAFFQIMLLAGYFVAHLLARLTPRKHTLAYILLLGLGVVFLPVGFGGKAHFVTESPGAADVFLLLTLTVAVPFIALSATSSTAQRLFMTTGHHSSKDPYFLYAASNLGSFTGLLIYPFIIEPYFSLTTQARVWMFDYVLLIALATGCLALSGKGVEVKEAVKKSIPADWKRRLEWTLLAFFPSSLLLGLTTFITTDMFSVPLIWVLPLGLYLLTFVIAFSRKPFVSLSTMESLFPYAGAAGMALVFVEIFTHSLQLGLLPLLLVPFFAIALYCHMRLATLRPLDNDARLTEFYLFLSIGGALGGIFNAFIIPHIVERTIEYPLMLLASMALHPSVDGFRTRAGMAVLALVALIFLSTHFDFSIFPGGRQAMQYVILVSMLGLLLAPERWLILGMTILFAMTEIVFAGKGVLLTSRNFFGVTKIYDASGPAKDETVARRYMVHGTTVHGLQLVEGPDKNIPTSYFSRKGPLGDIFAVRNPKNVAVIGLGTGSINCYTAPGRSFTFFEIDPDIVTLAQEYFTFLSECKSKTPPRFLIGDGRLELAKLEDEKFDLFILDAFSSDVIPTHLLTRESLQLYFDRLEKGGLVALHISNRYFRLHSVIAATADELGLQSRFVVRKENLESYGVPSVWLVLARPGTSLTALQKRGWVEIPRKDVKPWTDDYTNLLSTLSQLQ